MISYLLNLFEEHKCKRGIGIFRPWNREDLRIFHINLYKDGSGRDYIEQIRDSAVDTMLLFTGYPQVEFIDRVLLSKSTIFHTFFHQRLDEKKRWFEGVTLSFALEIEKNRFDRVDIIFEDMAVDGIFDGEVNQVRLYVSPLENYLANDYDLLYWDASDRRSLEVFQTAYQDSLYFFKRDRKERELKSWRYRYLNNFQEINKNLKNSSFVN